MHICAIFKHTGTFCSKHWFDCAHNNNNNNGKSDFSFDLEKFLFNSDFSGSEEIALSYFWWSV